MEKIIEWATTTTGTIASLVAIWVVGSLLFCLVAGGIAVRLKRLSRRKGLSLDRSAAEEEQVVSQSASMSDDS